MSVSEEVVEAEWGAVRGEGGEGGRDFFAGVEAAPALGRARVGVWREGVSAACGEIGSGCCDAGLFSVIESLEGGMGAIAEDR